LCDALAPGTVEVGEFVRASSTLTLLLDVSEETPFLS